MRCTFISIVAGLTMIEAKATVVYQQTPNHAGAVSVTGGSAVVVADDFLFSEATLLRGLTWWGGFVDTAPTPYNFALSLYADAGGQPGALLGGVTLGAVSVLATGQTIGGPYPEFEYSADFSPPVLAQAGSRYWLSLTNSSWSWEISSNSASPGVQRRFNIGPWQPFDINMAFALIAVPEPGPSILAATALAAAGALRRRKRC